jgi:hypothetical protein
MQKQFTSPTVYFLQEGRDNLRDCLKVAFQSAKQQNVFKIIIFTARGEGVRLAIESFKSQEEYSKIKIVAVAFPNGKVFTDKNGQAIEVRMATDDVEFFREHNVPIVRAHLPFDPITPFYKNNGMLGQDLSLVSEALGIFGGSMGLCVQAITMACDAGEVEMGEHVIAMTSDTAILAQASNTDRMLGELIVREVLCKAAVLTITRRETSEKLPTQLPLEMGEAPIVALTDSSSTDIKPKPSLESGDKKDG